MPLPAGGLLRFEKVLEFDLRPWLARLSLSGATEAGEPEPQEGQELAGGSHVAAAEAAPSVLSVRDFGAALRCLHAQFELPLPTVGRVAPLLHAPPAVQGGRTELSLSALALALEESPSAQEDGALAAQLGAAAGASPSPGPHTPRCRSLRALPARVGSATWRAQHRQAQLAGLEVSALPAFRLAWLHGTRMCARRRILARAHSSSLRSPCAQTVQTLLQHMIAAQCIDWCLLLSTLLLKIRFVVRFFLLFKLLLFGARAVNCAET